MIRNFVLVIWSSLALAGLSARHAQASIVVAMGLEELTRSSDRVVIAQVVGVTTRWDARERLMTTRVELSVEETLKGETPANRRVWLVQMGGRADGLVVTISGQPSFQAGERAVLFLEGTAEDSRLTGMGQGKRVLRLDGKSGRWMAEPGDQSSAVRLGDGGGFVEAALEGPAPLAEVRTRVLRAARVTP